MGYLNSYYGASLSRQFKCLSIHNEPIVEGNSEIIQKTQRALLLT